MSDDELNPSEIGTKEYWQKVYQTEIDNFDEFGDTGEVWFGIGAEKRIIKWICDHPELIQHSSKIIDLGCGNGSLLISLAEKKYSQLTGVDYSEEATVLAKKISAEKSAVIDFRQCDILDVSSGLLTKFNVVLDKGTFDAICLMKDSIKSKTLYKKNVLKLFSTNTGKRNIFIIASCNWTREELVNFFNPDFQYFDEIDAPCLQFGGTVGKSVTTVIFQPSL